MVSTHLQKITLMTSNMPKMTGCVNASSPQKVKVTLWQEGGDLDKIFGDNKLLKFLKAILEMRDRL